MRASHWPDAVEGGDIRNVTIQQVRGWRERFPRIVRVLGCGGSPCQDLSSLQTSQRGLQGDQSRLLFDMLDLRGFVIEVFGSCDVRWCTENVFSMAVASRQHFSELLGVLPFLICASLCSWVARPRLFWVEWVLQANPETWCLSCGDYQEVQGKPWRPSTDSWLRRGGRWSPSARQKVLNTFVRWKPRKRMPQDPRRVELCRPHEVARWEGLGWPCSPYHMRDSNCVVQEDGSLDVVSVCERERAMGSPTDYTIAAVRSGLAKSAPAQEFATRASLIGNSMHLIVMAWLFSHLAVEWGYLRRVPTWQELWENDVEKLVVRRESSASCGGGAHSRSIGPEERLVLWLSCHADSRGSDVRITTGELFRPNKIGRQHIETKWWSWKVVAAWAWCNDDSQIHINELELRAALTELKRRCRTKKRMGLKYLHLLDSAVALGVLTKKRSSSHRLQRVVRRFDALETASGCVPIFSFCRSSHNPADYPSRVRKRIRTQKDGRQS